MAKGIASGFPFAALGTRRELDDQWPTGSHGGTYGGNPLGCAAALATIEVMSEPGFLDNVRTRGSQLRDVQPLQAITPHAATPALVYRRVIQQACDQRLHLPKVGRR